MVNLLHYIWKKITPAKKFLHRYTRGARDKYQVCFLVHSVLFCLQNTSEKKLACPTWRPSWTIVPENSWLMVTWMQYACRLSSINSLNSLLLAGLTFSNLFITDHTELSLKWTFILKHWLLLKFSFYLNIDSMQLLRIQCMQWCEMDVHRPTQLICIRIWISTDFNRNTRPCM